MNNRNGFGSERFTERTPFCGAPLRFPVPSRTELLGCVILLLGLGACGENAPEPSVNGDSWWRGNLHTHTLWSDGDDFPEVVLEWYKTRGYDFVALSDHNSIAEGERWLDVSRLSSESILDRYITEFGDEWVNVREVGGEREVRLKTYDEYRNRIEAPGRFLVIRSQEITDRFASRPIHVNATNIRELVQPRGGSSVQEVLQNNVNAVLEQRERTRQPMFPHVNHPNFGWALTAEDLIPLQGEKFFEVYNGHPAVHNEGDSLRPASERLWDIILAERLRVGQEIMYGIAVDDAHSYQQMTSTLANPGRAWVMVRADTLSASSLITAMEEGDFYASTGVVLEDVLVVDGTLSVLVRPELGISYSTTFVGTKVGYDTTRVEIQDARDSTTLYRYSDEVGEVLKTSDGNAAHYELQGDELYVRAVVISTRPKENPYREGEYEMAWTQPILVRR